MTGARSTSISKVLARAVLLVALAAPVAAIADPFIGGTTPDHRPAGAPVEQALVKSPQWYAAALTGVSKPYPSSLNFLDDQGRWFNPFTHPGMTGPYDIRGWHAATADRKTN